MISMKFLLIKPEPVKRPVVLKKNSTFGEGEADSRSATGARGVGRLYGDDDSQHRKPGEMALIRSGKLVAHVACSSHPRLHGGINE
jgi:hypothetical protein